jgi:hypothetical protein
VIDERLWRAGGFLQAVLNGYPGIRIRSDGMFFLPNMFENVAEVRLLGIGYLGNRLDVVYDSKSISFTIPVGVLCLVSQCRHARIVDVIRVSCDARSVCRSTAS